MYALFAACAPGLEPWLRAELEGLGAKAPVVEPGGVRFGADDDGLYRVALMTGLAMTLRLRLGRFTARRFEQVVDGTAALPWAAWIAPNDRISVKATCRKSRLYHSTAVAERVASGLRLATGEASGGAGSQWQVQARLVDDVCSVSLDLAGEPLYRRGYRLATAKAPLRPDLAHALLVVSEWSAATPLIDTFCGAGTICIEAAVMARRLPPGGNRTFAFMRAPSFDRGAWHRVRDAVAARSLEQAPAPIIGSDRDAGAVAAAAENAARAKVAVQWEEAAVGRASALHDPPGALGLWASNPPFGRRTGDVSRLLNLYQSIGGRRRTLPDGWRLALAVADGRLARATGVPLRSVVLTDHGGTKVRLMVEDRVPLQTAGASGASR